MKESGFTLKLCKGGVIASFDSKKREWIYKSNPNFFVKKTPVSFKEKPRLKIINTIENAFIKDYERTLRYALEQIKIKMKL